MEEIDWGKGNVFDLEEDIKNRVLYHLDRAWRTHSNNSLHAINLLALLSSLKNAGYRVEDIYTLWDSKYNAYKADGGRAKYVEIGG